MVFSDSDRAVIEACFREFPGKKWSRQSVNGLVKKIEDTGNPDWEVVDQEQHVPTKIQTMSNT